MSSLTGLDKQSFQIHASPTHDGNDTGLRPRRGEQYRTNAVGVFMFIETEDRTQDKAPSGARCSHAAPAGALNHFVL